MADLLDELDTYDFEEAGERAATLMRPLYLELLRAGWDVAANQVDTPTDFVGASERVEKVVDRLANNITGISNSTKDEVRALIERETAREAGTSVDRIASQLREMGLNNSKSRAQTIARTESATAYNLGATTAYKEAGIERVTVLDGDEDEACAEANGQVWTLEEAEEEPIAHPNCQRAFSPLVD